MATRNEMSPLSLKINLQSLLHLSWSCFMSYIILHNTGVYTKSSYLPWLQWQCHNKKGRSSDYIIIWEEIQSAIPYKILMLANISSMLISSTCRKLWLEFQIHNFPYKVKYSSFTAKASSSAIQIQIREAYIYIYIYSIHVPGWLQKWLNLITAPSSVSNEPGSVTWLATKYLKTVSWRNHTEKINHMLSTDYIILA